MLKAYVEHRTRCVGADPGKRRAAPTYWILMGAQWGWVARAAAYDVHLDRQAQRANEKKIADMRERHAAIAASYLAAMSLPVKSLLQKLQDPVTQQQLQSANVLDLLGLLGRLAFSITGLTNAERLARGVSTAQIEVEDTRDNSIAERVRDDPEAARLAVELGARLVGALPGGAERMGESREPVPLEDVGAPRPAH